MDRESNTGGYTLHVLDRQPAGSCHVAQGVSSVLSAGDREGWVKQEGLWRGGGIWILTADSRCWTPETK